MATGSDAVARAEKYIGVKESPRNSNKQMFGEWFGMNGVPWCAIFLSYILSMIGIPTHEASVYYWREKAKKEGRWFTSNPQIGDLIVFAYGDGHIGILCRLPYKKLFRTYIDTIEGNTSAYGSQSNGGQVMRKSRLVDSRILGYIRPAYSISPPTNLEEASAMIGAQAIRIEFTKSGNGYWIFSSTGGVYTFGDAQFYDSLGNTKLNKPIVSATRTQSGNGYYMVASDGGVFCFGDAVFYGSLGNIPLASPIVDMKLTPSGNGYMLIGADGGVFTNLGKPGTSFGDADNYFWGSAVGVIK